MRRILTVALAVVSLWAGYARSDTLEVLHSFTTGDGQYPQAGLTMDAAGNLYGTTANGGVNGFGTVFQLTPNESKTAWTETVLHHFCSERQGFDCLDGKNPLASLIMDAAGSLYGTTASGGASADAGVLFRLTPNETRTAWTHTVLHTFCSVDLPRHPCADGQVPYGSLTMDPGGNLYGTTYYGGIHGRGAVFQLTPDETGTVWTETLLHSFCSASSRRGVCRDGQNPVAGLVRDAGGNLYGTTNSGGEQNAGVVFRLTPPSPSGPEWTKAILHSFCSEACLDGAIPNAGLIVDSTGSLYGAAAGGGLYGLGTVFRLRPDETKTVWTHDVLHSFCAEGFPCSNGMNPLAALTIDANGNLYGTAQGGTRNNRPQVAYNGHGVLFQLTPDETQTVWTRTVLHSFCSNSVENRCLDGLMPEQSSLTMDAEGNLYGTTRYGGTVDPVPANQPRSGTVFVLKPN
jgi:uncharacterized repeat protein (TIGR03803 family)